MHLIPHLGALALNAITTEEVQRFKAALGGKAPKTVNNILAGLSVLLKAACEWRVIDDMPCRIKLVPMMRPKTAFHDFDLFEQLVEGAREEGPMALLIVLLGGEAGLRCGEMMALEWSDVDLTNGRLAVTQSEWKGHVTAPKGGRIRSVPLTERLAAGLRQAHHLRGPRVLLDQDGRSLTQKVTRSLVARAARRAGVRGGVHILRHTFCSHLAMHGAPVGSIQALAGHQDLRTTQGYMHLTASANEAAIRLLDRRQPPHQTGGLAEAAGN